jgi:hypothetical protein
MDCFASLAMTLIGRSKTSRSPDDALAKSGAHPHPFPDCATGSALMRRPVGSIRATMLPGAAASGDTLVTGPAHLHTNAAGFAMARLAPTSFNRAPGEMVMAKGQMRSNKEKKKPKADKNLKKGGAAPVNPFAAGKTPAGQSPNKKS